MLYLIHGDQEEATRNKLVEQKMLAKGKEIRELQGKSLDPTQLTQALESSSMFSAQGGPASGGGGDVMVVIEAFISNAKKREKRFAQIVSQLIDAPDAADVILYERKEIDKTTVAKLGSNTKVFLFKTPVVIFQFLDSLRPGYAKQTLPLLHMVLAHEAAELVFTLLIRRVRQLIELKDNMTPDGLQSWQAARLTATARHFTMDELIDMHRRLVEMDIAIKSGSSPFTLAQHLEQFTVSL